MKVSYLLFNLMLLVGLMSSACGNIAQPQMEQTTISPLPTATQKIVQQITSPIAKVTLTPTAKKIKPIATPLPTSSPTLSPTPTIVSSPILIPSPAFVPLPPLDEDLQTIIFTTNSEHGPKIWRVQVDERGQKAGPLEQINFLADTRTQILGLFPSSNENRIAIGWVYSVSGTQIDILDVANGLLTPLFGKQTDLDTRATFLDWTPNEQNILVMGTLGSDLSNSAWLVDTYTHTYHDIDIKQTRGIPLISSASFSPDGQKIAYVQFDCSQCGSEIWLISTDGSNQKLLLQTENTRVDYLSWAPDGQKIAFVQWLSKSSDWDKFDEGQLYMTDTNGNQEKLIDSLVTHFDNRLFYPVWSPDGNKIAFVKSENVETEKSLEKLISNIYVIDVFDKQINQLTHLQNAQVVRPIWSPSGSEIAFLTVFDDSSKQPDIWTVTIDNNKSHPLNLQGNLQKSLGKISNLLNTQFSIVWLPSKR